jgi:hypothetical protein
MTSGVVDRRKGPLHSSDQPEGGVVAARRRVPGAGRDNSGDKRGDNRVRVSCDGVYTWKSRRGEVAERLKAAVC